MDLSASWSRGWELFNWGDQNLLHWLLPGNLPFRQVVTGHITKIWDPRKINLSAGVVWLDRAHVRPGLYQTVVRIQTRLRCPPWPPCVVSPNQLRPRPHWRHSMGKLRGMSLSCYSWITDPKLAEKGSRNCNRFSTILYVEPKLLVHRHSVCGVLRYFVNYRRRQPHHLQSCRTDALLEVPKLYKLTKQLFLIRIRTSSRLSKEGILTTLWSTATLRWNKPLCKAAH